MPATYRVSSRAKADLKKVAAFTIKKWGSAQAIRYLARLEAGFELLASRPSLGRRADRLSPGLRRYEYESHVIFYRFTDGGILVSRVLHERQLASAARF